MKVISKKLRKTRMGLISLVLKLSEGKEARSFRRLRCGGWLRFAGEPEGPPHVFYFFPGWSSVLCSKRL